MYEKNKTNKYVVGKKIRNYPQVNEKKTKKHTFDEIN